MKSQLIAKYANLNNCDDSLVPHSAQALRKLFRFFYFNLLSIILRLLSFPLHLLTAFINEYEFNLGDWHLPSPRADAIKCQTPDLRDGRTDEETRRVSSSVRLFVRSFVSLSVVSVTGVHPMGE